MTEHSDEGTRSIAIDHEVPPRPRRSLPSPDRSHRSGAPVPAGSDNRPTWGANLAVMGAGGLAPDAPFELHLDQTTQGAVVSARPGHYFTGTLPSLDDSLLFIELEGKHVGLWLST